MTRLARFFLAGLFIVGFVIGIWVIHLDREVVRKFEAPHWILPSKVYSDTTRIWTQMPGQPKALAERLDRLDYRSVPAAPRSAGEYRLDGSVLTIGLRRIETPFLARPEQTVRVSFSDGRIASIQDLSAGVRLEQFELEPQRLTGFFQDVWEERRLLALNEIPPFLIDAVIAAEDRRFSSHFGLDLRAIARAGWANFREGRIVQGGSTITQQLVKNFYLTSERTWERKLREAVMAVLLERRYTKDEILETYLNEIYMGQNGPMGVYGVGEAAAYYFGVEIATLTKAELATLAAVIRSPNSYSPMEHPERVEARRNEIVRRLADLGRLDPQEAETIAAEAVVTRPPITIAGKVAPYYADRVLASLTKDISADQLAAGGLSIYTELDPDLQSAADAALRNGLAALEEHFPALVSSDGKNGLQGAVIVIEPASGRLKAIVGGRDYGTSQFNRATQARRQPGSLFKPLVYLSAFEAGSLTAASLLDDSPLEIAYHEQGSRRTWSPRNDNGAFQGPVTVRTALQRSLNIPVIRAAQQLGLDRVIETARRLGLSTPLDPVPSLALGTFEVSPIEMATAYATIANQGLRRQPAAIRVVTDEEGKTVFAPDSEATAAVSPEDAFLAVHLLEGVVDHGTAKAVRELGFLGPAAGKTGTTDGTRDAWFIGFTPELLALVWVGFDDNRALGLAASQAALPIWTNFMRRAEALGRVGYTVKGFSPPPGIEFVSIDPKSGLLANFTCPGGVEEAFRSGTAPAGRCSDKKGFFARWAGRLFSW